MNFAEELGALLYKLGMCLFYREKISPALHFLNEADKYQQMNSIFHRDKARVFLCLGNVTQAFKELNTSLELNAKDEWTNGLKMVALILTGKDDAADELYNQLSKSARTGNFLDWYLIQWLEVIMPKRVKKTVPYCIARLTPLYRHIMAAVYYDCWGVDRHLVHPALIYVNDREQPSLASDNEISDMLRQLASMYQRKKCLEIVLGYLAQSLQYDRFNVKAYEQRSMIFLETNHTADAAREIAEAEGLGLRSGGLLCAKAICCIFNDKLAESRHWFDQAKQLEPESVTIYSLLEKNWTSRLHGIRDS